MEEACKTCLKRGWLLAQLSVVLDYRAADEERLLALLELPDEHLIEALAGGRKAELRRAYAAALPGGATRADGVQAVCQHGQLYPERLRAATPAPRALHAFGGLDRMASLLARPTVAIVGTRRASDYGMVIARELARALARSDLTVVTAFAEGIARAVCAGLVEAREPALTAMAGGVDICRPAGQRGLWQSLRARGCLLSELPGGVPGRRWCEPVRERIVAGLCDLMVLVEAGEAHGELRVARMAERLGKPVGALPGRLTSRASRGTNELLARGAHLILGPEDVLELLALPVSTGARAGPGKGRARDIQRDLESRLRAVLDRVGLGQDTLASLTADGSDPSAMMAALGELELLRLLRRGDAGRYVPCP
jgi:DNA processing protein